MRSWLNYLPHQAQSLIPARASACLALALAALLSAQASAATTYAIKEQGGHPAAIAGTGTGVRDPDDRAKDLQRHNASAEVQDIARWALQSGDAGGKPFIIIDKLNARLFVFNAWGELLGVDSVLLGMAVGDHAIEGIGDLRLAAIRPQDRVTQAGRFVTSMDRDLKGQEILWIDYDSALALHRVIKGQPSERRAQRLLSDSSADNRITYGCINAPVLFYEDVVIPALQGTDGIVYILPEVDAMSEHFNLKED